jgi:hypothetical protein
MNRFPKPAQLLLAEVDLELGELVFRYHYRDSSVRDGFAQKGGSSYKLSKNRRFGTKNKGLLKNSIKLTRPARSTDRSITAQSEMTMTGQLLNPTKADFPPEGLLPHESAVQPRARVRNNPAATPLAPPARLKRFLNVWEAAANAYREREAAWLAAHRDGGRRLNSKRIYRGPIDDALERAARIRKRRRAKPF